MWLVYLLAQRCTFAYLDTWCLHARHFGRNPSQISEIAKYKGNVKKNENGKMPNKLDSLGVQNCWVERFCMFYERINSLHDQYFEFRDFTFFVFLNFSFVFCSFANFGGISTVMASVEASDIEMWGSASFHRRGYSRSNGEVRTGTPLPHFIDFWELLTEVII